MALLLKSGILTENQGYIHTEVNLFVYHRGNRPQKKLPVEMAMVSLCRSEICENDGERSRRVQSFHTHNSAGNVRSSVAHAVDGPNPTQFASLWEG